MSFDLLRSVSQAASQTGLKARKEGNHNAANGCAMIVFGVFLLPIPIIGIPLIVYGIYKVFSS